MILIPHNYIPIHAGCTQGDIRLEGGSGNNEGRVEVCNNNKWGTVCGVGWDLDDGNVACHQAGFGPGTYINFLYL